MSRARRTVRTGNARGGVRTATVIYASSAYAPQTARCTHYDRLLGGLAGSRPTDFLPRPHRLEYKRITASIEAILEPGRENSVR